MSQKVAYFCDKNEMSNTTQPIDDVILRSMRARQSASAFSAKHFAGFGTAEAVRQALSRLARVGKIRRVRRGVYDLPREHPLVGVKSPDPMAAIKAVMDSTGTPWQVSGAYAANAIGISDQVPARVVVLTTGNPRKMQVGKTTVYIRQTAPRFLLAPGTTAGLIFQGVRWMGKDGVTDAMVNDLQQRLQADDKRRLTDLIPQMPRWMQPLVQRICTTE
jgi:predicted transcriptional regulator of viral defense system